MNKITGGREMKKRDLRLLITIAMVFLFAGLSVNVQLVTFTGGSNTLGPGLSGFSLSTASAEEVTGFKWIPRRPGITRAQIALGRAVTLPFEFTLSGNVQKVRFEIPKKFSDLGIDVADDEVVVKDGKAKSSVVFTVPPGKPLGRFELDVIVKDAKTGKELGKGTIPFMLLPPGVGGC
jgi:hypothetical protein